MYAYVCVYAYLWTWCYSPISCSFNGWLLRLPLPRQKKKDAETTEKTLSRRADELRATIKRKREAAEGDKERDALLEQLTREEETVAKKRKELEAYADSDPDALARMSTGRAHSPFPCVLSLSVFLWCVCACAVDHNDVPA